MEIGSNLASITINIIVTFVLKKYKMLSTIRSDSSDSSKVFKSKENYLNFEMFLNDVSNQDSFTIPFVFTLPWNLPSTQNHCNRKIEYFILVEFEKET